MGKVTKTVERTLDKVEDIAEDVWESTPLHDMFGDIKDNLTPEVPDIPRIGEDVIPDIPDPVARLLRQEDDEETSIKFGSRRGKKRRTRRSFRAGSEFNKAQSSPSATSLSVKGSTGTNVKTSSGSKI